MKARLSSLILATLAACMASAWAANTPQEEANKATVLAFYEKGLNQKDGEAAARYFGPYYKQHNPHAADGAEGFKQFIQYLKKEMPESHSTIKRAFADGDYVILHIEAVRKPGERGSAIVDIFRLEQGKIVEHWDVIQDIPAQAANPNTMF